MKTGTSLFLLGLLVGCASTFVLDPSINSVQAGDYTLIASACGAVPGIGMDICNVKEGTAIASSWRMVLPGGGTNVLGGTVDVYYRDIQRSYGIPVGATVLEIPWSEFFNNTTWTRELDGEAMALVTVSYKDAQGLVKEMKLRGLAKIVVTDSSYTRMPIDSGQAAWPTVCKFAYSTAGRSAMSCK